MAQCTASSEPVGWQNLWAWLPASTLQGRVYKCGQIMNKWQLHVSWFYCDHTLITIMCCCVPPWLGQYEGKFFELGVSMRNESMPLMYNFTTIDATTHERIKQVFCFGNFTGGPPSSSDLLIPNICLNEGLTIESIPKNWKSKVFVFLLCYTASYSCSCHGCLAT